MNLFEQYQGIYISPAALEVILEHESALTIEGPEVSQLKARPGEPPDKERFNQINQDGITIFFDNRVDQKEYNLNIDRSNWWKPGKLQVYADKQKFPHPRL